MVAWYDVGDFTSARGLRVDDWGEVAGVLAVEVGDVVAKVRWPGRVVDEAVLERECAGERGAGDGDLSRASGTIGVSGFSFGLALPLGP